VPVPLPVIIVKVQGPYTERDRKLWTFLLHAVWDELGVKPVHELPVSRINQIFRDLGGEHDAHWIWESAQRLTRTIVEWERIEGDDRYQGLAALFQAEVSQNIRLRGRLRFAFPPLLIPILKEPRRFARLRVHFLIGLSGKYAVTLYELLEGVANKAEAVLDVRVETLRQWLKVPAGKLATWDNFNRRAIAPAIAQINTHPAGAGFTVTMQPVKQGRAVDRVRFTVHKVDERRAFEEAIQGKTAWLNPGGRQPNAPSLGSESVEPRVDHIRLSTSDYERAQAAAPRWDIYELERQWREWIADKDRPANPGGAFVAFCRKKARRVE